MGGRLVRVWPACTCKVFTSIESCSKGRSRAQLFVLASGVEPLRVYVHAEGVLWRALRQWSRTDADAYPRSPPALASAMWSPHAQVPSSSPPAPSPPPPPSAQVGSR